MNFWQMFAINQALASLHVIIRLYGAKYLTAEELAAGDVLLDGLAALPERMHAAAPADTTASPRVE